MGFAPYSSKTRSDRSAADRTRHRQKIAKALRDGLQDAIVDESITSGIDKKIKIPVKSIKEYRFVYGDNNNPQVKTGDGNVQRGQTWGRESSNQQGKSKSGAGEDAGEDYLEVEVEMSEIVDLLFDGLSLPEMDANKMKMLETERVSKHQGTRKEGIRVRLDKRKTAMERIKRKLASGWDPTVDPETGEEDRFLFIENDFRYKHIKTEFKKQASAVIFFVMDVSGSMGIFEKYNARSLFFFIYNFIHYKYEKAEVVFVAHHTVAQEVDEHTFFHKGESGGTIISSALNKTLEIMDSRYPADLWNIYTYYCSDGDNLTSDNEPAMKVMKKIVERSNQTGYVEINQYRRNSTIMSTFKKINDPRFKIQVITDDDDVWHVFRSFFETNGKQGVVR